MERVRRSAVVWAVLAAVSCAVGRPPAADTAAATAVPVLLREEAVREAIEAANTRFSDALVRGDVVGLLANYREDAVVMMPEEPAWNGRAAMEIRLKELLRTNTYTTATFTIDDVIVAADVAVETGSGILAVTPRGAKARTVREKYLTVWRRQLDGSLKIIRDIANYDASHPH